MNQPKLIPTVGFFLAAAILFSGCSKKSSGDRKPPQVAPPVPVLVAAAIETNVPIRISAIGNVVAYSTVSVRSQISGQLQKVHFQEGREIKKGDLLFTIDPRPSQAALDVAKANLSRDSALMANAKIQFERQQKLFDQKLVSQDEYDTSKATMDALTGTVAADQSAITNAMLNLAYTEIRSPIDGMAGGQLVFIGNIIKSSDDVMVVINQIHPIYVLFSVPERYLPEIKSQTRNGPLRVDVIIPDSTNVCSGELTFVDNAVDTTTGTIQLKGTFGNTDNMLWPGQYVQVSLKLSELSHAIMIPSQAIQVGQDGQYVYVVKEDQTVEQRPITTGIDHNGMTVVQAGLKTGETVVTDGQLRLAPGVKASFRGGNDSGTNTIRK